MKTFRIFNPIAMVRALTNHSPKSILIFFLLINCSPIVKASDYYWIGNGGNWSSLSHWATTSGGTTLHTQLPDATDDVFFDVNSFTLPGQTLQLVQGSLAHDLNWAGVLNTPTFAGAWPATLRIYGSLTLTAPMNMTYAGLMFLSSTSTGETITTTGNIFSCTMILDGIGGEWTLQDAFNSTGGLSISAGTFNTNDKSINTSSVFCGSGNPTVINCGSSVFTLTGTSAWGMNGTNITFNAGTSVINCTAAGAYFSHSVTTPVIAYNDVNFVNTSTTASRIEGGTATFHNVDFAGAATVYPGNYHNLVLHEGGSIPYGIVVDDMTLSPGKTYSITSGVTVNGSLHANGTCDGFININLGSPGNQAYGAIVSPGNINISHVRMAFMMTSGGGTFTATDSYDYGANTGWTFAYSSQSNKYWVGNGGNWSDPNHWATTSGGTPSGCPPLVNDNVFFDENSFTTPGQIVVADKQRNFFRDMYWTNVSNTPAFNLPDTSDLYAYGSLSFSTDMTSDLRGDVEFFAPGPGNIIRTGGQTFHHRIIFWGLGEWTLMDDLNSESTIAGDGGTLNTNDKTVNATEYSNFNQTLNMGSSVFNLSGLEAFVAFTGVTINAGTSVINCTGNTAVISNEGYPGQQLFPHTYHDVNFTGMQGEISGPDSFHNVVYYQNGYIGKNCDFHKAVFHGDGYMWKTNSYDSLYFSPGHAYTLGEGAAQVIRNHWQVQGTCTDSISIHCTVPGSYAFFVQQTDSVIGAYLKMKYIQGTGGATFKAYNSNDEGFNVGWNFTTLPPIGNPGPINGPASVCYGASNVSFHISPVPGALSYQWTVPPGASIINGQGDTLIIVDLGTATSGNISVQASDGCSLSANNSSITLTIEIPPTPTITLTASPNTAICAGTPVTFTATATGSGTGTLIYNFKINGISVQDGSSNTYISTTLSNGDVVTCTLTVNGSSCFAAIQVDSDPITLNVLPLLTPAVTISVDPSSTVCPATIASFTASASGFGTGTVNYDFRVNGNSVQNGPVAVFSSAVLDNDVISCMISVSGGSCYTSTTALSNSITMHVDPAAVSVFVQAGNNVSITTGQSIQLHASGDAGIYLWTPATGLSATNILDPIASPAVTTVYILTITNAEGCTGSGNLRVEVKDPVADCKIGSQNAFTPNGDGINDKWIAWQGNCFDIPAVKVFNRYGTIVFQSEHYNNDWQGNFKGKPLPDGTYYAVIIYKSYTGQLIEKKIDLTILR